MSKPNLSVKKKISRGVASVAAVALAGGMVGMSTSAQADGPTCGLLPANVTGTYRGLGLIDPGPNTFFSLNLNSNSSASLGGGGAVRTGTWSFSDSSIIVNLNSTPPFNAPETLQLLPSCAGVKVRPEVLTGGTISIGTTYTYVFHRQL
ncbi:hypothetical protein ACIF8W_28770 [Streptomyces sp. NPDC085639]|uniref:hypothetical protein n=1 Tax=Streptomyces sp. NPDC085639 TaxID=3365734 RepID=UPI0037D131BD